MTRKQAGLCGFLFYFSFIVAFCPSALWAQVGTTGSLSGDVKDATGAILPGVSITVANVGTGLTRTTQTDGTGRWTVPALPVGVYQITYELQGFKRMVQEGVSVEAAVPRTVEVQLEVESAPGEEVTVTENVLLVSPDTASTYRQISSRELLEVPTSTRSFTHLLSSEAGISADLPPVLGNSNGNISPSVNGTRTTSTSLQFNGVDATNLTSNEGSLTDNIAPAPETLEEVKLQTSLYDASTGRSGGGNFQLVTKSGTNEFHGSAYWYVQNEKFNANDFFYNKDRIDRPRARRNEGGFAVGGPLVKDKTFFFGGYQRTQANTAFVPTAQSITVLPKALQLISGQRTAANVAAAFRSLNPNFPLSESQISPLALSLLNLRNPATGDFLIPAPRAGGPEFTDQTISGIVGGNPFVRQRNVFPAEFQQDQFTIKIDQQFGVTNRLSGTLFFSNFPGFDPFPDPSSLASPVTLRRNDRGRALAISDLHTFSPTVFNEARFGLFFLNNTRSLDDPFLALTNEAIGIPNPANFYDQSNATTRLGHYVFRNNLSNLSWGGPNDSFNLRDQKTFSFADNVSWIRGSHNIRIGGEYKRHFFDTNLPEEQATEFEKFENFTQFLRGVATEADTQFGITDKRFRMNDLSWYVADDWKVGSRLTLNVGLRWDWFGWPTEVDGRIGNFDFSALNDTENPVSGFLVPANVRSTGFAAIDNAIAASTKVGNNHTLKGQDLNNLAPRFGFAYSPFDSHRLVVRGGYGVFFDRPSAAFINTVFSNYPFLREVEVTFPSRAIPLNTAWSQQDPTFPFNRYLPNRLQYQSDGTYVIRDGTNVTKGADGRPNSTDLATGLPALGNIAETFEFRAIDRDLRTPYVQQWNLGFQFEVAKDLLFEARYLGTKGTKLLQATAFNQSYDLNDSGTPDYIFGRFNRAYDAAYQAEVARTGNTGALRGPLKSGASERERGAGVAFGFANPVTGKAIDYNLMRPAANNTSTVVIPFEARGPILGFNIPEAVLLQSSANSIYNALQLNLTKRMSRGIQFNTSYTWSKSLDNNSADPGSTAGGGKPDVPNVGFVVQGNQRELRSNRAVSDFDRTHRFSLSFVYDLPSFGSKSRWITGWQFAGFGQLQTGAPFSIFTAEPEIQTLAHYTSLARSGGLYRLGFGRPSIDGTLDQLRQKGSDPSEEFFNKSLLVAPAAGGFGNLGRNVLRGDRQQRFDVSLSKRITVREQMALEFRWEIFNLFNNVNFALPANDLQDSSDFGKVLNTIGGPRVMQFGLKFVF
ncbi:MAG: TonB-dependent receptor [Acidobacteriota bacterium]